MNRRLLNLLTALSQLLCVAVMAMSVRWSLGLDDQAYVHLRSTTIRIEAESEMYRIVLARFLPHQDDRHLPVVAVYPAQFGANEDEHYGDFGDILGWSSNQTHFLAFAHGTV